MGITYIKIFKKLFSLLSNPSTLTFNDAHDAHNAFSKHCKMKTSVGKHFPGITMKQKSSGFPHKGKYYRIIQNSNLTRRRWITVLWSSKKIQNWSHTVKRRKTYSVIDSTLSCLLYSAETENEALKLQQQRAVAHTHTRKHTQRSTCSKDTHSYKQLCNLVA